MAEGGKTHESGKLQNPFAAKDRDGFFDSDSRPRRRQIRSEERQDQPVEQLGEVRQLRRQ